MTRTGIRSITAGSAVRSRDTESGTALVLALFLITVLTVLGTMVLNTSIVEIKMAGNQKISSQVFYAAEAGLERGLLMLINDFENDTTADSPWGNDNYAGWGESVTSVTMSGGTTFDPDVRSLTMYTDGNDAGNNLKKLTLGGGHTVNNSTFDLYIYNQGSSEAWVMSHAFGNGGIAAVEYHLKVDNVSPYNNAIFTGAGISGQFQGSVNVAGSIYSKGSLNLGAGVEMHNFYGGANHPGNAMPGDLEALLDDVVDLKTKLRVKGGDLTLASGSVQIGSSYLDTSTGEKGSIEGIYVDGSTNIQSVGGPHYYDDHQSEVPDVPMPRVMDGLKDEFGAAYIDSCKTTSGYTGNDAAVATSLYADWVSGSGCWSASSSVGVVFDASAIPGSMNIIQGSTPSFAFSDGLGNGLFWDTATDTLKIVGNVVIKGDLDIGQSNGNDNIIYEVTGDDSTGFEPAEPGTLFCSGNVGIRGNFSPDPTTSGYLNPGQGINSLGIVTPQDITFSGKPGNYYAGLFYAEGQVNFNKQAALAGTVIGGLVNFAQVPDVYQVPNLKDYLPRAVPGGSDVFMLQNREWRRVY